MESPTPNTPLPVETVISDLSHHKALIGGLVIILVGSLIFNIFFGTSYKRVTNDLATKNITIQNLQTEVETWKKKSYVKKEYYPNGKLKSDTEDNVSMGSDSKSKSYSFTDDELKKHDETVTKRGGTLLGAGYGTTGSENLLLQTDLLSPFGLASTASFSFIPLPKFNEAVVFLTFKP